MRTPYGTATVPARPFRDDKTQRPCGSRWPYRTVSAVRLPQRNHAGQRVGTPKVASDQAASRFGFRSARRRFQVPSVAAAAASRRAPATSRRLPHTFFLWQPKAGTKPGGLVPLPDPLSQQFNQQSNEQLQNILGWRHVPPRRASPPGYRRGDLADSPRYQTPHGATGSTLPPLLRSHTCIAPSGERLTSTRSA